MDFSHLTDHEIKALLMHYDSEMRKLNFQLQSIQATIQNLHAQLSGVLPPPVVPQVVVAPAIKESSVVPEEETTTVENMDGQPKKRGRKRKETLVNEVEETPEEKIPKKRGRKKKEISSIEKRGYTKNSPWPGFVLEQFAKYGHILSSGQLYDFAIEENMVRGYGLEVTNVRNLVSRALHKLANVEGTLAKLPVEEGAKGYNYAPKEWLDKSTGELKEKYIPK